MDVNSLSHSKWNCKYHIVFAPKFRRKVAYGALRQDIANILIDCQLAAIIIQLWVLLRKLLRRLFQPADS